MELMRGFDKSFLSSSVAKMYNLIGVIFIDNFEEEKIKNLLIERAIKKIKILRSRIIYTFFDYYWKEIPINHAIDNIKILKNDDNSNNNFNTKEDVIEFANKEISKFIDVFRNFPYEIFIIHYGDPKDKKGAVLIKSDHILGDGLSAISLFCGIADNYSPNVFPVVMQNKQIPFLKKLCNKFPFLSYSILERAIRTFYCTVTFPYYAPLVFFKMMTKNFGKTPFKNDKNKEIPASHKCNFKLSKAFDLQIYNDLRRKEHINISFNELMMGTISMSIKKICDKDLSQYGHLKEIMSIIPIGLKGIPESRDKIEINNKTNAIFLELGLISNLVDGKKTIRENFTNFIKAPGVAASIYSLSNFFNEFFPLEFIHLVANIFFSNADFMCTNVPGPREPLYYAGSLVTDIIPIVSSSGIKTTFIIFSYNNKFRFNVCSDEKAKLNRDEFVSIMENKLEEILNE